MIETRAAFEAVDAILATPGLDGIFLGPADLSVALSGGSSLDPSGESIDAALVHALDRGRAAQKLVGVYATTGARAATFLKQGFPLVAVASDAALLRLGAKETIRAARR